MNMVAVNSQCIIDAGERESNSLGSGPVPPLCEPEEE